MSQRLGTIVLGAGGHAAVVAEAVVLSGMALAGYLSPAAALDDAEGLLGPYRGDDSVLPELVAASFGIIPAIGFVDAAGAARRAQILTTIPVDALVTIVHPAAIVSPSARLGAGSFVAAGAILGTRSRTGTGAILNSGAVVDHDCLIGSNCHIATGARVAGGVTVGNDVLIGSGATIRQGLRLGEGAVIGAGAVVIHDVEARTTVVGIPAKPVSKGAG